MRKRIRKIISHPLISGSAIIVIGSTIGNLFNYIFNLGMGRLLTASEYGILASLISIISIFLVFSSTVNTVFSKFSASYVGQKKEELIGVLIERGNIVVGVISLIIITSIILVGAQISEFLHIKEVVLVNLIAVILFFSFLSSVTNGVLQGTLKFTSSSIIYISHSVLKVIIGIGLVIMGFKVLGAVLGMFFSVGIGYLLSFVPLRSYFNNKDKNKLIIPNLNRELSVYAVPVFLSGLGITMLTSIDIILVKHFFKDVMAGQYAALSLIGRVIFFAILPIASVFFSLIAQKKERKENLSGTILLTAVIVGIPSILAALLYFFFPQLVLNMFFPAKIYASLAPYLGPFSIFIILYTFAYFLNSYYLSIGETKVYIFSVSAAILEIIFIVFFHQNIPQIITGLITISFLLLVSLLLYYPHRNK